MGVDATQSRAMDAYLLCFWQGKFVIATMGVSKGSPVHANTPPVVHRSFHSFKFVSENGVPMIYAREHDVAEGKWYGRTSKRGWPVFIDSNIPLFESLKQEPRVSLKDFGEVKRKALSFIKEMQAVLDESEAPLFATPNETQGAVMEEVPAGHVALCLEEVEEEEEEEDQQWLLNTDALEVVDPRGTGDAELEAAQVKCGDQSSSSALREKTKATLREAIRFWRAFILGHERTFREDAPLSFEVDEGDKARIESLLPVTQNKPHSLVPLTRSTTENAAPSKFG